MKSSIKNLLKFTIFIFITLFLIYIIGIILTPETISKSGLQGQTITTKGYYELPPNSIDVLFLGDSTMLNAVSPMELWNKYGIVSYNNSVSSVRTYGTYYLLKDALKTQTPKLVVIDSDTMFYKYNFNEPHQRAHIDHLKDPYIKFELINDKNYPFSFMDKISTYFPLFRYHSRWSEFKFKDLKKINKEYYSITKGFVMASSVKPSTNADTYMNEYDDKIQFENNSYEYLEKIYEYCQEKNITLMIMQLPNSRDWGKTQNKLIQEYADEHNIKFLDFNTFDFGLNWDEDTKDAGAHLNVLGAMKLNEYLAEYLKNNFDLPDHREEELYANWHDDFKLYEKELNEYINIANKKIGENAKNSTSNNRR